MPAAARSSRAARWLADNPAWWLRALEASVRALNALLLSGGILVAAWACVTVAQIRQQTPVVPWFVPAFGAVGAATALASLFALLAAARRSVALATGAVTGAVLALAAQAGVGVAAWVNHGWEAKLPPADEAAKEWLLQRLAVVKWVGAALALLELLTVLLSCALQSAYVAADEAAEDAEEEAALFAARRRPLLGGRGAAASPAGQARDGNGGNRRWRLFGLFRRGGGDSADDLLGASRGHGALAPAGAAAAAAEQERADWAASMERRYGVAVGDEAQPPLAAGGRDDGSGSRCAVM
jgi:hypothetical protein